MKINNAYKTLEELQTIAEGKSKKIHEQLLVALNNLRERDIPVDQLQSIEEAIEHLCLHDIEGISVRELKGRKNQFLKEVRKTLSLVPEDHYTALGLAFGVAFGAMMSAVFQGFAGSPQSSTGLGIGIGLIAGYFVGSYLDVVAKKQNRVLTTRPI